MRFATVWKYGEHQWFQNMTNEALCIVTVLFTHRTDDIESIDSSNNSQLELLGPDLLLHFLRDIISQYTLFRKITKF
jgi:hypothetical protein